MRLPWSTRGPKGPGRGVCPRSCAVLLAAALLAVPFIAPGGAAAGAGSRLGMTALEQSTIDQINALRASHGLAPLAVSPALFEAASVHCREMVAGGYFGHQTAAGLGFADRIERFYPPRHFAYYAVGENLFWTQATASGSAIVAQWLRSAEHRANLLKPAWQQIGLAAVTVPSAPGIYQGLQVTVVTVDFGVRA